MNAHRQLLHQYKLFCLIECNREELKNIINLFFCFLRERINEITINIIPYVYYPCMLFISNQYQIRRKIKAFILFIGNFYFRICRNLF